MVNVGPSHAAVAVDASEARKRNISEEVFELRDKKDSTVVIEGEAPVRTLPVALVTMKERLRMFLKGR